MDYIARKSSQTAPTGLIENQPAADVFEKSMSEPSLTQKKMVDINRDVNENVEISALFNNIHWYLEHPNPILSGTMIILLSQDGSVGLHFQGEIWTV